VDGHGGVAEPDEDLDGVALGAGVEFEQWVLIEAQLFENTGEAQIGIVSHGAR
jgi:hypothetical protein